MNNITEHIRNRRSVRTYDGRELDKNDIEKLTAFAQTIENPYKIPVDFKFMNAKEYGLNCPVVVGTNLYVGGKIKCTENASVAFGYSFEMLVLYAQSMGIGTVWLGGTMNRSAYEEAMELGEKEIKPLLAKAIDNAIAEGYVTFITGMAMGTDIWAAEIVLERKKTNKDLHLICALPHPNFESRRSLTEKMRFDKIIKKADLVKEINNHYFTGCYQVRNEWMVDRSNLVIVVFNGQKSGTKNMVDYAKRKGLNVVNVLK